MRKKGHSAARNIDGIIRPVTPSKVSNIAVLRAVILLLIIILVAGIALFVSARGAKQSSDQSEPETATLKATVEKHYVLPTNEEPVVATITDTTKLSSAFQGKASNGDRLLIYQKNQQAIVYRPSIDRVVNVVPVQIDTPQGGTAPQ